MIDIIILKIVIRLTFEGFNYRICNYNQPQQLPTRSIQDLTCISKSVMPNNPSMQGQREP